MFQMFRVNRLRITTLPNLGNSSASGNLVLGYTPVAFESVSPTTFQQTINACAASMLHGIGQTTPSSLLLTSRTLRGSGGSPKWWKIVPGTETNELTYQGQIFGFTDTAPTQTEVVTFVFDGMIEFAVPLLSGESVSQPPRSSLSPLMQHSFQRERAEKALISTLRPEIGIEEKSWADMDAAEDEPPEMSQRIRSLEAAFDRMMARLDGLLPTGVPAVLTTK